MKLLPARALPLHGAKALLAIALLALLINTLLAALVYWLVMPRNVEPVVQAVTQFVEFVRLVPAAHEFNTAQLDTLPPPPPPPQPAPQRTASSSAGAASSDGAAAAGPSTGESALPAVALPEIGGSAVLEQVLAASAPAAGGGSADGHGSAAGGGAGKGGAGGANLQLRADEVEVNLTPSYRLSPNYPLRALKEGIEGVVTVEFEIDTDGNVREPHILHAEPPALFDEAVMNALPKWKFTPKLVNGKPVARRARQDVAFRLHRQ